ncbi:uncharacterized protein MELLADRAFT_71352, partial [Melampsora larici-populina 98AG31]
MESSASVSASDHQTSGSRPHDYSQPHANHQFAVEQLPTYTDLKDQEGHRFGRWKSWIEKRARERVHERDEERREVAAQGRSFGTGWDPPDYHSTQDHLTPEPPTPNFNGQQQQPRLDRNPSIISSQNETAAFASAAQHHKTALLRASKGFLNPLSATPARPFLEPGPGAINLTPSTSVHQIGSRFLPQFNSQPLCAVPLPLNHPNLFADGRRVERFLLV